MRYGPLVQGKHRGDAPATRRFDRRLRVLLAALGSAVAGTTLLSAGFAHQSKQTGLYDVPLGFLNEPPVTETLNGLHLIVQTSAGHEPVDGLEKSLEVTIVAPASSIRFP